MYLKILLIILLIIQFHTAYTQDVKTPVKDIHPKQDEKSSSSEDDDIFGEKKQWFKLSGHYKNLFTATETESYYGDSLLTVDKKKLITDLNRIRLSPEIDISKILIIHVDYDNELIKSNFNKSYEFNNYWRTSDYNNLAHMTWEPFYDNSIYYRSKIHRAYAKISVSDFTISLGRQQIRFGSGRLWNPLDILNPISPTFAEGAEEQKGTDALKLDYYINEFTELTIVYDQKRYEDDISKLKPENSNSIGRIKTSAGETDIALLGGFISRRRTGGLDIASVFLDGLLRGSVLYSKPEHGKPFSIASSGYEYTTAGGFYLLLEYFFNQGSLYYDEDLMNAYMQTFITGINQGNYFTLSNRIITYNRHYSGLAIGYDLHPLIRSELFSIYDFQGRGLFINFSINFNLSSNIDFNSGIMTGKIFDGAENPSDFSDLDKNYMLIFSLTFYF